MSDDLQQLENWIGGYMARLSDAERKRLGRRLSLQLRAAQSQRIAAQKNPDGSAYEPRKQQREPIRAKKGRIRRKLRARAMFAKLRRPKHLGASATPNEIEVGFEGAAARVATVHQRGLRDRVSRRNPTEVNYPKRVLLDFTETDRQRLMDALINHVTD